MNEVQIDLTVKGIGLSPIVFPVTVLYKKVGNKLITEKALATLPEHEWVNKRLNYHQIDVIINGMDQLK